MGKLVQYIIIRSDLLKELKWPVGAVIAQACHACCAVMCAFTNDGNVQEYLQDLDNMHKVVLEVSDEPSLQQLEQTLRENGVDHKLWIEHPENIPTCLALKPYPKEEVHQYFKKLKLYRG